MPTFVSHAEVRDRHHHLTPADGWNALQDQRREAVAVAQPCGIAAKSAQSHFPRFVIPSIRAGGAKQPESPVPDRPPAYRHSVLHGPRFPKQ